MNIELADLPKWKIARFSLLVLFLKMKMRQAIYKTVAATYKLLEFYLHILLSPLNKHIRYYASLVNIRISKDMAKPQKF